MGTGHLCCGVFSLTLGVEIICLLHLTFCIVIIGQVSSVETSKIGNMPLSPTEQVIIGAWATAGIPIIVGAGVGVVYHVEKLIRAYFWYLFLAVAAEAFLVITMTSNALSCKSLMTDTHGPASTFSGVPMMVCGIASGLGETFGVVALIISGYCLYIVWTVKEIFRRHHDMPGLLRYYSPWLQAAECSRLRNLPPPVVGSHPMSFNSLPDQVLSPAPALPVVQAAPMISKIESPVVLPSVGMPSRSAVLLNNDIQSAPAQLVSPRSQASIPTPPAMPRWATTGRFPPNSLRAASPVPAGSLPAASAVPASSVRMRSSSPAPVI